MDGKSHMEIICLLPSSVCIRKLIFHPRHAFGLTSYKSLFSDGEGTGTWQLHQYQAMLVGTSGDTRRNFFIRYIHIFSSSTSLFFSETNHHGTVQGCQKLWLKEASWGKVLRVPLLVPGTGGSKLIVRKDFKAVTHMQVGALLRVPSGYSILSCFSCRWDLIDNTWA